MKEEFLHYWWRMKYYGTSKLFTSDGNDIQIIQPGIYNTNAGPDFNNAVIKIGDVIWSGDVEMHIKSSDWNLHRHEIDPAYERVILHVVWTNNKSIFRNDGSEIPVVILDGIIPLILVERYHKLTPSNSFIPCESVFPSIDPFQMSLWLERMLIEKWMTKESIWREQINNLKGDWSQFFHLWLTRCFGLKVNADAFMLLAERVPYSVIRKIGRKQSTLEAVLLGVGGFLDGSDAPYQNELASEYKFQKSKFQLTQIPSGVFKSFRARPDNHPIGRITQLASLMVCRPNIWDSILASHTVGELNELLKVSSEGFWSEHSSFKTKRRNVVHGFSQELINSIIVNAICPSLYFYGLYNNLEHHITKAIEWMIELKGEKNSIIEKFRDLGILPTTALDTQGLLFLKHAYCDKIKCLDCNIGHKILSSPASAPNNFDS